MTQSTTAQIAQLDAFFAGASIFTTDARRAIAKFLEDRGQECFLVYEEGFIDGDSGSTLLDSEMCVALKTRNIDLNDIFPTLG